MNKTLCCIDVYTVSSGDTLYSVADKYDVPVSLLMKVNYIENPYNVEIGTKLCIPGDASDLPSPEPRQRYIIHTVSEGDTLYLIAKKHGARLEDIMNANPDVDPYNMLIGSELAIPVR